MVTGRLGTVERGEGVALADDEAPETADELTVVPEPAGLVAVAWGEPATWLLPPVQAAHPATIVTETAQTAILPDLITP